MGTPLEKQGLFRAGLYLRLSKDDEGPGESASISTQRDILKAYAREQEICVAEEYVDDGYSGTNYDRPAFRRMIAAIDAGIINCVITKDLSRLGRNSARTTELLEEFFPRRRIRFISVTDGFDSFALTNGIAVATPFMLVLNEFYARDISQKIRASFQSKMEKGDFISSFAPYGYRKDPENKNHLLIDEEAARVVRFIFQKAADGCRPADIAKVLMERHIPTPAEYRCLNNSRLQIEKYSKRREWTSSMLCKMLRNGVYLGQTVHGKTSKLSFKSKERLTNKPESWIVVEGTHEPIISKDLFEQVGQRSTARRCSPGRGFHNVFSGIAVCADCGRNMTTAPTRKKGSTCNLCCGSYKEHRAAACSNHFIDYDTLYRVVQEELHSLLCLTGEERQQILASLGQAERERSSTASRQREALLSEKERRLRDVKLLIRRAFECYALGGTSEETYARLMADYENERAGLEKAIQALMAEPEPRRSREDSDQAFFALLDDVQNAQLLTGGMLRRLIDRIEVEQGHYERDSEGKRVKRQTVRIYYKFIGRPDEAS